MKWYYQAVPGDSWDYDSVQQLTLADLAIGGRQRRVIMQANKNGYFYVIDRITGEFISASPFAPLNWSEAMDKKTGRPFIHPRAFYRPSRSRSSRGRSARTTGRRCRSIRRPAWSTSRRRS